MIAVRDVWKAYGATPALCGISFDVARGQCVGLLGPNGAGKSTVISLLSGLRAPDRGAIYLDNHQAGSAGARRSVGIAPQAVALYPELTVRENLRLFSAAYRMARHEIDAAVSRSLEIAQLHDRADARVSVLSGGMQRRLNLAVAILHDPACVVLDEPTVAVDPQSRAHLRATISALRQRGKTVLLTTHQMEEAAQLCDVVAIIDAGRIVALGPTAQLCEAHGAANLDELFLQLTGRGLRDE